MRLFLAALFWLFAASAQAALIYPCDITTVPAPVECYGQKKMLFTYSGNGMDVYNPATGVTQSFTLANDDYVPGALSSFLNGQVGRVTKWYGQKASKHLTQTIASTQTPSIQDLQIGGAPSIVFQGDSQSGAIFSLVNTDITSLGITAQDYSVVLVLQATSSMFYDQSSGFSSGAVIDLDASGNTVLQVLNNSNNAELGGWQATDGAFNFISPQSMVYVNPIVLTITSDATGVKIYQNGQIRATGSRSAKVLTAVSLYLGKLSTSVVGPFSKAGGFQIVAAMFYNVGLTQAQQSTVANALYGYFYPDIVPSTSNFSTNGLYGMGDSIDAGYVVLGIYGYMPRLQYLLSKPVRVLSYAVPGSTITPNPIGVVPYANTLGLFPLAIGPSIPSTKLSSVCIVGGGGNDPLLGPGARGGTANGTTTITLADTSNLSIGDFVYASSGSTLLLPTLTTILSIVPNTSITVSNATVGSGGVLLQFTYAATSPAVVFNGKQSLANSCTALGANPIVTTILKRDVAYQPFIDSLNTLIRAGVGYTLADCAAYPGLDTNPGPSYGDTVHLTALGAQEYAECLAPYIEPFLH